MQTSPPGSSSGGTGTSPVYTSAAAPYTIDPADEWVNITVGGLVTIPAPADIRILRIRRDSLCLADITFSVTFDGAPKTLSVPKENVTIVWNGSSWEEWP